MIGGDHPQARAERRPALDEPVGSSQAEPAAQPRAELGRTAAFSAFYKHEMPRLVAFLMAMGSSIHDAKDDAQEAMRLAYSRWDTISSPRAWTRKVASSKYMRRVLACQEDPAGELPEKPGREDLTHVAVIGQEQSRVLKLLWELPPRQRQIMAWTYDGYAPKEIAEHLGIEANTVRVTLHNARQALKERLAREGGQTR